MRLQVGHRLASVMLAFILLASGMCVESVRPADFYLSCNPSEITDAVVSSPKYQLTLERMCTPHVLRQSASTYFNAKHRRDTSNRERRILMAYSRAESILSGLCISERLADNLSYSVVTSHASIVSYIQLQDGKK